MIMILQVRNTILLSAWLTLNFSLVKAQAQDIRPCYTPNGDNRNAQFNGADGDYYAPCSSSGEHTMCCAWGTKRQEGNSADVCRNDGLCENGDLLWRESCTDRTWQAPECKKLFVNHTGYYPNEVIKYVDGMILTDVTVTVCDDGSFCYDPDNRACCRNGEGVFLNANGEQVSADPNGTSTSITSSSSISSLPSMSASSPTTTSSTPSSTAKPSSELTAAQQNSDSGDLSTSSKTAIGAGIGGGVIAVAACIGVWLWSSKRSRRGALQHHPQEPVFEASAYTAQASPLPVKKENWRSSSVREVSGNHTQPVEAP